MLNLSGNYPNVFSKSNRANTQHGLYAEVAQPNYLKAWEAFIIKTDRVLFREQHKALNTQKHFEKQTKAAQQSTGEQIDARCDLNYAGFDAK